MKSVILKTILPVGLIFAMTIPAAADTMNSTSLTNNRMAQVNTGLAVTDTETIANTTPRYMQINGRIASIDNNSQVTTISVTSDSYGEVIYNISDTTLIYSLGSTEKLEFSRLTVGQSVSVYYSVLSPQTMSLPPQVNPEVIVVRDNLAEQYVKVDYFDENSISSDGVLKLNSLSSVLIVDEKNNVVKFEDALGKNLIVFYNDQTSTSSTQARGVKVVILSSEVRDPSDLPDYTIDETPTENPDETENPSQPEGEIQTEDMVANAISALGNEVTTKIDDTVYVQISPVAKELGFTVEWDPATALVTLRKDNVEFTLTPGQTQYSYNRSLRYFDTAPFIENDRTYVEYSIFTLMK